MAFFLRTHRKTSRVEIYKLVGDSLVREAVIPVYGRVVALLAFRPAKSLTDHLLIAISAHAYFTVSWDPVARKVRDEVVARDVADNFSRDAKCGPLYVADPGKRLLGLHMYQGTFLAIPLVQPPGKGGRKKGNPPDLGNIEPPCAVRFSELDVLDMALLDGTNMPTLAVLHKPLKGDQTAVVTYEIQKSGDDREFKKWEVELKNMEQEAQFLIPVPSPLGGFILVGVKMVVYCSGRKGALKRPLFEPRVWTAWGMIDGQRFVLGDEEGNLCLLLLMADTNGLVTNVRIDKIGEVRCPFKKKSVSVSG